MSAVFAGSDEKCMSHLVCKCSHLVYCQFLYILWSVDIFNIHFFFILLFLHSAFAIGNFPVPYKLAGLHGLLIF